MRECGDDTPDAVRAGKSPSFSHDPAHSLGDAVILPRAGSPRAPGRGQRDHHRRHGSDRGVPAAMATDEALGTRLGPRLMSRARIFSPSTVREHLANATVRPGRGCVVRMTTFPFTTRSRGCWLRSSGPIEPVTLSPECSSKVVYAKRPFASVSHTAAGRRGCALCPPFYGYEIIPHSRSVSNSQE
jgi:hypothetical protein